MVKENARQYGDFEEVMISADNEDELEVAVQDYFCDYPESVYGTTITRGKYVTLDGKHRAELRRWIQ